MGVRDLWFSRRALLLHLVVLVLVPTFLGLGWWQFQRARSGNTLSWAYVFEWPIFAGYVVFMWWKMLHEPFTRPTDEEQDHATLAGIPEKPPEKDPEVEKARQAQDEAEDEELAAYNQYLASLQARDQAEDR